METIPYSSQFYHQSVKRETGMEKEEEEEEKKKKEIGEQTPLEVLVSGQLVTDTK